METSLPRREAYIPLSRQRLLALLLVDPRLDAAQRQAFGQFADILSAFIHHRHHRWAETIKAGYRLENPDAPTHERDGPIPAEAEHWRAQLHHVLNNANYQQLDHDALQAALEGSDLIELETHIDFDDFEHWALYVRGLHHETLQLPGRFWGQRQIELDVYERVVLLLRFRAESTFTRRNQQPGFEPGRTYAFLYRQIPRLDLELLFPNVVTRMKLRDLLLLVVPALGAGVSLLFKVLPQLLLIIGLIALVVSGAERLDWLQVSRDEMNELMPVLITALSLGATFGGFAAKQYGNYQRKQLGLQKRISDTLFFRNLASNASVFRTLIDESEEEACKESLLIFHYLLLSDTAPTLDTLDAGIEEWLADHCPQAVDFDVRGAVMRLAAIEHDGHTLAHVDEDGCCHVPPLEEACRLLDALWDQLYTYA